jgi:hypothetical protein
MHGKTILNHGFKQIQAFVKESYWDSIQLKLEKQTRQLDSFYQQLDVYVVKLGHLPPLFFDIADTDERKKVLSKFTKTNVKLPRMLDPDKLTHVCSFFVDRTLERILVNFDKDFAKLQRIVFRH